MSLSGCDVVGAPPRYRKSEKSLNAASRYHFFPRARSCRVGRPVCFDRTAQMPHWRPWKMRPMFAARLTRRTPATGATQHRQIMTRAFLVHRRRMPPRSLPAQTMETRRASWRDFRNVGEEVRFSSCGLCLEGWNRTRRCDQD